MDTAESHALATARNPDAVRQVLASERQTAREARQRASELERRLTLQSGSVRALQKRCEDVEAMVAELRDRNQRLEVALAKSLPADLIDLLRGNTREQLAQDAERLLTLLSREKNVRR